MTRPISITISAGFNAWRDVQITPDWVGQGLAVHKPVTINKAGDPVFREDRGVWQITHIHTGLGANRFIGSLDRAIAFARKWDEAFAAVTSKNKVPAELRKDYLAALQTANNGPSRQDITEAGV